MPSLPLLQHTDSSVALTLACPGLQGTPQKSVMSTELLRMGFTGVPEQSHYTSLLLKARAVRQCSPDPCAVYQPRRDICHAVRACAGHSKGAQLSLLEGCVHRLSASLPWLPRQSLASS